MTNITQNHVASFALDYYGIQYTKNKSIYSIIPFNNLDSNLIRCLDYLKTKGIAINYTTVSDRIADKRIKFTAL